MSIIVITGSSGLVGSECVRFFHEKGFDILGIDNNKRQYFFGKGASVEKTTYSLKQNFPRYDHRPVDICDSVGMRRIFSHYKNEIVGVIHTAAQPSHDWSAREPLIDFQVNALGTVNLLELVRTHCPEAVFIFTSTNKVYGDRVNSLNFIEEETRYEPDEFCPIAPFGISEKTDIDDSTHSPFGASKLAADIMVQEYGRYFGIRTGVFRAGCITGPAHAGAELHGFLSYLVKYSFRVPSHRRNPLLPYNIYGYKGKQVRDNIHSSDLVDAFWEFYQNPRPGEVYNIGGSNFSNCSILEAIAYIEKNSNNVFNYKILPEPRVGDHIWWISDVRKFQSHYPNWKYKYGIEDILSELIESC